MNISIKEIILIVIVELLIMFFLSQLFLTFVWLKYRFGSSQDRLLSKQDYKTNTEKNTPKKYRFVVVRYNEQNEIIEEIFYKALGDFNTFKYNGGQYIGSSELLVSNLLLAVFPFTGFFLIFLNNLLSLPVTSALDGTTIYNQQLVNWGLRLFFPSFLAFLVKFGIDPLVGTYDE